MFGNVNLKLARCIMYAMFQESLLFSNSLYASYKYFTFARSFVYSLFRSIVYFVHYFALTLVPSFPNIFV